MTDNCELPCLALSAEHRGERPERLVHTPAIGENIQHGWVDDHNVGALPVSCRSGGIAAAARQMLDFVEYLMRYLFVLPEEVKLFHNDITQKNQETSQPSDAG